MDDLLVLNVLFFERHIDLKRTAELIQKGENQARAVLERLHEGGLIEGRGEKRGRVYILSGSLYQQLKMQTEYMRAKGLDLHEMEKMILAFVKEHEKITRTEVVNLCKLNDSQAKRLLLKLTVKYPQFQMIGKWRGSYYIWNEDVK